jgi:hypothetical protein
MMQPIATTMVATPCRVAEPQVGRQDRQFALLLQLLEDLLELRHEEDDEMFRTMKPASPGSRVGESPTTLDFMSSWCSTKPAMRQAHPREAAFLAGADHADGGSLNAFRWKAMAWAGRCRQPRATARRG